MAAGDSAVNLLLRITGVNGQAIVALNETAAHVVKTNETIEASNKKTATSSAAAGKAAGKSGKAAQGGAAGWAKYGTAVTAAAVAVGGSLFAFAKQEQALGALEIIFGENYEAMLEWTNGAWEMGLSQSQAASMSAILGAQLTNLGVTEENLVAVTQGLITTAGNLAAVMGGTVPQAVAAMGAALRNEFDPLEQYGITINAAMIETQMLANETAGLTFATDQQAKSYAILQIIQEQAAFAAGALEAEQETLTASTGRAIAATKDLAAALGEGLGPVVADVMGAFADFTHGLEESITQSEFMTAASDTLTAAFDAMWALIEPILIPALELLSDLLGELGQFLETYVIPILETLETVLGRVGDALGKVVDIVKDAIEWFDNFTDSIHDAIDALSFWNDTYDPNADNMSAPAAAVSRYGVGTMAVPTTTINITTGVGDPHAIAREIRRILKRDEQRLGRVPA